MKTEILRMDHVNMGSDKENQLTDFHLSVYQGELVNLIGLTGSGKSAFWKYFSGNMELESGVVRLGKKEYRRGKNTAAGQDVVCLGNQITLIDRLSVAENLFVISDVRMRKIFIRSKSVEMRARILLSELAPFIKADQPVSALDYGQRRIVELVKAVAVEAKLIVIDDVFMSFGKSDIENLLMVIKKLRERGVAMLYISHCQDFLTPVADRVAVIRNGAHIRTFYPEDFDRELCDQLLCGTKSIAKTRFGTGRPSDEISVEKTPVLRMQHIFVKGCLQDFDCDFFKGEITGFYDAENRSNGCLLNAVVGEEKIDSGQMLLQGRRYQPRRLDDAIKQNIGYISRDLKKISLIEQMSFADNLFLPVMKKTSRLGALIDFSVVDFLGREYCDSVGIEEKYRNYNVKYFDEYIRMSILVYRWLLFKPKLMVCVEPCSRADMIMREIIFDALRQMAADGCCVLMASPDIDEMRPVCDKIYYLKNGKIEGVLAY